MRGSRVTVREVRDLDDFHQAVRVQQEVWGFAPIDVVPARLMVVVTRNGGLLLGAFERKRMVGFAFGYPGYRDGRAIHCSHMLGVVASHRTKGLGQRLKQEQRRRVLALGLDQMIWTFDPLEGRNAYLNLHRLGARTWEYWENLYGRTSSALHSGVETDRFVARWQLDEARTERRSRGEFDGPSFAEVVSGSVGHIHCASVRSARRRHSAPRLYARPAPTWRSAPTGW